MSGLPFWTILAYLANVRRISFIVTPPDCRVHSLMPTVGDDRYPSWELPQPAWRDDQCRLPAVSIGPCIEAAGPSHLTQRRTLTFLRRRTHGKKDGGRLPRLPSSIRLEPTGDSPGWIFRPGGDGAFDTPRPPPLDCGDVLNSAGRAKAVLAHLSDGRSVPTGHVRPGSLSRPVRVRGPFRQRSRLRSLARFADLLARRSRQGERSVRLDTDVGLSRPPRGIP